MSISYYNDFTALWGNIRPGLLMKGELLLANIRLLWIDALWMKQFKSL